MLNQISLIDRAALVRRTLCIPNILIILLNMVNCIKLVIHLVLDPMSNRQLIIASCINLYTQCDCIFILV